MWYCTSCSFIYQVAADTLIYESGGLIDASTLSRQCLKCDKKLFRLYQHKNPKYGKQQWLSVGWYCDRCKYAWIEDHSHND